MGRPRRPEGKKEPKIHYIPEWAERRGLRQADIVEALAASRKPVDKASVSRWFNGALPVRDHLLALQGLFGLDEPAALFRHPDDDWLAQFFRNRSAEERYRIRQVLEAAFPAAAA